MLGWWEAGLGMRFMYLEQPSSLQLVHYEWRDDCMYSRRGTRMRIASVITAIRWQR